MILSFSALCLLAGLAVVLQARPISEDSLQTVRAVALVAPKEARH